MINVVGIRCDNNVVIRTNVVGIINAVSFQPANLLLMDSMDELVLMDLGSAARSSVTVSNR